MSEYDEVALKRWEKLSEARELTRTTGKKHVVRVGIARNPFVCPADALGYAALGDLLEESL